MNRQALSQIDRKTGRQKNGWRNKWTGGQTDRCKDRQINVWAN
jgi:hypothetical protein